MLKSQKMQKTGFCGTFDQKNFSFENQAQSHFEHYYTAYLWKKSEQAQCIMDLPDDKYRMEMKREIKKNL